MWIRIVPVRATLCVLVCASGYGCSTPGAPTKATTAQIDQMNQEIAGGSSSAALAPDWPAMAKKIQIATDPMDRRHWISEFAHHAAALPESLRIQRLAELKQLMREGR